MKARGLLGVFACAVALAAPAGAAAKPGPLPAPLLRFAEIKAKASHGYRLRIAAFSTNVDVQLENGDREVDYTVYNGSLRKDRVRARLPGVGWINLRFHEDRRYRESPADNCNESGDLTRVGTFVGRIRLEGEQGYSDLDTRSARGKIESSPDQACTSRRARASAAAGEATLIAAAPKGRGMLSFEVVRWAPSEGFTPIFFQAHLARVRGRMFITNGVEGFGEGTRLLEIGEQPLSAAVDPPGLFTGSAEFLQQPGDFTWLGNLGADLPGIGPVDLAGPEFEAMLCLDRRCRGDADLRKAVGLYRLGREMVGRRR